MRSHPRGATPVALLSLLGLLVAGCASLTRPWIAPEVMLTSIRPQQLGLAQQSMLVGLRISNPNDRTLPIKAMTYRLSLEGEEVAAGGGELQRQIPAFGEESVEVSLTGDLARLAARLPTLALQSRPWQYQIAGTVSVGGLLPLPYRYAGELDPRGLLRGAAGHN